MWVPSKPEPEIATRITRYRTIESRRIAVREALYTQPEDPRIQDFLEQLNTPEQIAVAVQRGVFINYSRHDEILALEIATRLRENGINVWLDTLEIAFESDWHSAVKSAIMRCGLMLTILSPAALYDLDAKREREAFLQMGKLILPIISEPCNLSGWDIWLKSVDFSRDFEQGMSALMRMLATAPAMVH